MNMKSRNQYLKDVRKDYLKAKSKKEKTKLLNEAEKRTKLNRKYLIRKLKPKSNLDKKKEDRKKRKEKYDGYVRAALAKVWEVFDYPCGQRLKPNLTKEMIKRLRDLEELKCSDEVAKKLEEISSATIDRKLDHEKEVLKLFQNKKRKSNTLLLKKIPVKMHGQLDQEQLGNIEVDFVEHCGSSARGEFCCTIDTVDINTGWQEWEAIMGRSQERTKKGLAKERERYPFNWLEIHPDNDKGFINAHLYQYTQETNLGFSRSRAYKKNDNCHVEQRNWFSIRKKFGYLRFDTKEERDIINDLYRNELRLYRNFFQPIMKLKKKIRKGSKIHRKYDKPKTPYQRVMESGQVSNKRKRELKKVYLSLNPAQLKRGIDAKLDKLYQVYKKKNNSSEVQINKKLKPRSVTKYLREQESVQLHS